VATVVGLEITQGIRPARRLFGLGIGVFREQQVLESVPSIAQLDALLGVAFIRYLHAHHTEGLNSVKQHVMSNPRTGWGRISIAYFEFMVESSPLMPME